MTAYYNDNDKSVAEWLRELIKAGVIPDGDVDERSILDVQAEDLKGYTQCHFFAGIAGWPLALRLAGWPDSRPVWTGSPPCQPFSSAGEGKGRDDARHLAPKFIGLVREGRPEVLFGEQVASAAVFGKTSKPSRKRIAAAPDWAWLDDLSDRLEAARYAVGATDIPSAGVGAPHIRQRTFFGAYDLELAASRLANGECKQWQRGRTGEALHESGAQQRTERLRDVSGMDDSIGAGLEGLRGGHRAPLGQRERAVRPVTETSELGRVAHSDGDGCGQTRQRIAETGHDGLIGNSALSGVADIPSRHASAEREQPGREHGQQSPHRSPAYLWDSRGPAPADDSRPDPCPTNGFWGDADWLFCRDGKWRPVEPGTFPLAHGVPGRVGLLRGYGNAINPWVAKEFIEAFEDAHIECLRLDQSSVLSNDTTGVFG